MSREDETFLRQIDLVNQPTLRSITVGLIGVGHINSIVGICLTKMGVQFFSLFDPDKIARENLATQFYTRRDIGAHKVSGLQNLLSTYKPMSQLWVQTQTERVTSDTSLGYLDVIFVGVDTISARISTLKACKKANIPLLIDIGTARTFCKIFVVELNDKNQYNKYLANLNQRNKVKSDNIPCTERNTFYSSFFASSLACCLLNEFLLNKKVPFEINADPRSFHIESSEYIQRNVDIFIQRQKILFKEILQGKTIIEIYRKEDSPLYWLNVFAPKKWCSYNNDRIIQIKGKKQYICGLCHCKDCHNKTPCIWYKENCFKGRRRKGKPFDGHNCNGRVITCSTRGMHNSILSRLDDNLEIVFLDVFDLTHADLEEI